MNCDNCYNEIEIEFLNGEYEPLEILYTCNKCGRVVLDVEGLRNEIIKEGIEW